MHKFVWHPAVHSKFGESLYFIYIPAFIDSRKVIADLQQALDKVRCVGYAIYEIYGGYDVLLRVWLTAPKWISLSQELQAWYGQKRIGQHNLFIVDRIRYFSASGVSAELSDHLIDKVTKNHLVAIRDGKRPADHFTIKQIEPLKNRIKFFVLLTPAGSDDRLPHISIESVKDVLQRFAKEKRKKLGGLTMYELQNQRILVKGTVPDLYALYTLISELGRQRGPGDVRSSTSLVAAPPEFECDDPDFEGVFEDQERRYLRAMLKVSDDDLDKPILLSRGDAQSLLSAFADVIETDASETVPRLIKGLMLDDSMLVRQSVSAIGELEDVFLEILIKRLFPKAWGNDWSQSYKDQRAQLKQKMPDLFKSDSEDSKKIGPETMTLAQMIQWLLVLQKDAKAESLATAVLGNLQGAELDKIREFRNSCMHARISKLMKDRRGMVTQFGDGMRLILRSRQILKEKGFA